MFVDLIHKEGPCNVLQELEYKKLSYHTWQKVVTLSLYLIGVCSSLSKKTNKTIQLIMLYFKKNTPQRVPLVI